MRGKDAHRLFFAAWPGPQVRARIDAAAQSLAREAGLRGRCVRAERLHLTLHFLGVVPECGLAAALEAGADVEAPPFELVLDRAGGFPNARVAWLGCTSPPQALRDLHARLRNALLARDLPVDSRAYAPHVTVQRGVREQMPGVGVGPIVWPVDAFVLIDSRPDRGYVELGRWPLRG